MKRENAVEGEASRLEIRRKHLLVSRKLRYFETDKKVSHGYKMKIPSF